MDKCTKGECFHEFSVPSRFWGGSARFLGFGFSVRSPPPCWRRTRMPSAHLPPEDSSGLALAGAAGAGAAASAVLTVE